MKEEITLKLLRHGKKEWSYQGGKPSRVEIAVLEYFRNNGWRGYFTEHRNYYALCALIIGWSMFIEKCEFKRKRDCAKYFSEKRKVISGGTKAIFESCSDGWLPMHEFSYDEVYNYFCSYDESRFDSDLSQFIKDNIKSFDVGSFYLTAGQSKDLNHEEVKSFFERFSIRKILEYIELYHPVQLTLAKKRLRDFDEKYREWHIPIMGRDYKDFCDDFRKCVDQTAVNKGIGMHFLFQPAFHFAGGFEKNIYKVRNFSEYLVCDAIRNEILEACDFADEWRNRLLKLRETATLDLQLWKSDQDMIVEVKAPNDRLRAAQLNTIIKFREAGGLAIVVKVEE